MRLILLLSLLVACSTVVASDQIPGAPQKKPIALVNAVVHTLTGPPVEKCTIIFDEGKITDVGQGLAMPAKAEIIDLKGQHVCQHIKAN